MATRTRPAAGASGGPAPLPATYFVPEFIRLDRYELDAIYHRLRDPLAGHLYLLIAGHCVFSTGEFLGNYARLMELCTPPQPERGPRRKGPSLEMVRRALRDLEAVGLVTRGEDNQAQGQLRLWLLRRVSETMPRGKANR
jgi:hypothetical protein